MPYLISPYSASKAKYLALEATVQVRQPDRACAFGLDSTACVHEHTQQNPLPVLGALKLFGLAEPQEASKTAAEPPPPPPIIADREATDAQL